MTAKRKKTRPHTPWDDAFKQLMRDTLSTWGLEVVEDPKLGKLPLKADLVIISTDKTSGEWRKHPLWQYLSQRNLVEFKSIKDDFRFGDFEVLLAYTLLYRVKFKIGYGTQLCSWLIVPDLNTQLKMALAHYQIELVEVLPGFWKANTLFPLYIVAYNLLPFDMPYQNLKLFIKSGKPVQEVFTAMLESEKRQTWREAAMVVMEMIHPLDAQEVLKKMGLAAERKELRKTIREILKDDIEAEISEREQKAKYEANLNTARQMKAEGIPIATISKCTGLSKKEIDKL